MGKKLVDATRKKSRKLLPDYLLFLILSKLPLKSLKKFACVCKSWAGLFENPRFMNIFRNNLISKHCSYNEDRSLFLHHTKDRYRNSVLFSLSGKRFKNRVKFDWPNPFQEDDPSFFICGSTSINGTLCLIRNGFSAALWNSTTGECNVIPPSPIEFLPVRLPLSEYALPLPENTFVYFVIFGYDPIRDDMKVIRRIQLYDERDMDIGLPMWEIYSLRSNSWRTLDHDIHNPQSTNFLYLDGMSHWVGYGDYTHGHWVGYGDYTHGHRDRYLISFDFSREVLFKTLMPLDISSDPKDIIHLHLVLLNGSIALISNYEGATTFHISVLAEVGVKESWTKLFILELPCIESPIGIGKKGEIFLRRKDGELVLFDLSTHVMVKLGVKIATYEMCGIILYN